MTSYKIRLDSHERRKLSVVKDALFFLLLAPSYLCSCSTSVETQHYIGVFDPQQQAIQELYRVRINGTAPVYSDVKYASGWVPAEYADLLTRRIRHDQSGSIEITGSGNVSPVRATRQFFEVGPLGIASEPENDRFVIVMGSNPDYFFKKIALLASNSDEEYSSSAEVLKRLSADRLLVRKQLSELETDN